MISKILTGAALFCATSAIAQTPDYLWHQEQFEYAAIMLTSTQSCKHFGMEVDDSGIQSFGETTIVNAVKDGINVETANTLFLGVLKQEQANQDFLLNDVKKRGLVDSSAVEEYLDYWIDRCARLSRDPRSSQFFVIRED